MLVAHATWHGGALCLWAERSGPYDTGSAKQHPYATNDFGGTSYEPLVRGAAVWAFGRIAGAGDVRAEAGARRNGETDATVRAEWQRIAPVVRVERSAAMPGPSEGDQ